MPLIFTREYIISVAVAIALTLIAKRAHFPRGLLWLLSTAAIILTLWPLGINPLGFAVSGGGWIMFVATVLIGWCIQALVMATR